jgi:sugar lactone lactonase YvrE
VPSFRLAVLSLVLSATPALAGPTRDFRLTTYKDFDEGEAKGTLLTSLGEVLPGVDAQRAYLGELLAFCAVRLDGNIYVGTGDQAAVWAARGHDKPRRIAKLDGVLVSALATGKGRLFAAATPGGRIYVLDKLGDKEARARELVKLDADHVWALAWDEEKKTLYAATGPNGKLFAIDVDVDKPSGKARVLWSSGDKHLLSMALTEDGTLLIGSADQAVLYRVRPQGGGAEVRVLHDFEGDEVRAIARDKGATYVAVNDFKGQGLPVVSALASRSSRTPAPAAGGSAPTSSPPSVGGPPSLSVPASRERKGKGAVYRVDDDGRVEQLHALSEGYFTALARDTEGTLWEAAGSNGRVYQVRSDGGTRTVATALDLPERQVLFLELGGGDPVLGTGDAGALYHLSAAAKDAVYISKALDAQFLARWGKIRWAAGGVELSTRSGNTQKPGATWSAWQTLGGVETHGMKGAGRVQSPPARFLQIKVKLSGTKSVLHDLDAYYLPQNQRARLTEITAGDEPGASRKLISLQRSPRGRGPILKLKWKAENPDEDELVYRVSFREEADPTWHLIGGPDPLTKTDVEWNTEPLPDGRYLIRVVASDERANAKEDALEHTLVSPPVLVDNKKPEVGPLEVSFSAPAKGQPATPLVNGKAKDAASPLTELAYSLDGGDWYAVAPKDGVFDDLEEAFSFRLPAGLSSGTHTLAIRAVDSAENIGAAQITFRLK